MHRCAGRHTSSAGSGLCSRALRPSRGRDARAAPVRRPLPYVGAPPGCRSLSSARSRSGNGRQAQHREVPVGLGHVALEAGSPLDNLRPSSISRFAFELFDLHPALRARDLRPHLVGVGREVVVPRGMPRRASRRGHDEPAALAVVEPGDRLVRRSPERAPTVVRYSRSIPLNTSPVRRCIRIISGIMILLSRRGGVRAPRVPLGGL
jgi:hypothetical protein